MAEPEHDCGYEHEPPPGADGDAVGQIRDGVAQVLYLACELLLVLVDEHQLVRDALDGQSISHMCADVTHTDHAKNSFLCHKNTSFLKTVCPSI